MAYESPGFMDGTEVAAADLSAKQFTAVTLGASGYAAVVLATTRVDGILQNKPLAGEACVVMKNGISKMYAGAAITKGAEIMCDTSGRCVTAATTGNRAWGVAREAAGAANVLIAVEFGFYQRILP